MPKLKLAAMSSLIAGLAFIALSLYAGWSLSAMVVAESDCGMLALQRLDTGDTSSFLGYGVIGSILPTVSAIIGAWLFAMGWNRLDGRLPA